MKIRKIISIILILIIVVLTVYKIYQLVLRRIYPIKYEEYVEKYSEEYGIDKNWIYALIKAESNFEKDSVSKSGAIRTYAAHGRNSFRSCRKYQYGRSKLKRTRM